MEIVATILYALDIAILISFQVLNRDYRLLAPAISEYGLGRTALLFKVYILSGSFAAPLLAWQFWSAENPGYPLAISAYLMLVALGRLGVGLYPVDLTGTPRTRAGTVHHAATLLAFGCAFMAVTEATPLLIAGSTGLDATLLSALKHMISLGFLAVGLTVSVPIRRYFGLAERLFLYSTALWFLVATQSLPPL